MMKQKEKETEKAEQKKTKPQQCQSLTSAIRVLTHMQEKA